ncbi:hypothetical protein OsJ_35895 [Oryza sativa Japonica Group]|uniref:Uncharacterized protein n=1 Tax=Oryza sativa subsp. japonica TaxID=39947 RepID=B9GCV7_ORYSJ|nr:hypothetical protein OsJ_35895 [Oryza sativa Japonica Group]
MAPQNKEDKASAANIDPKLPISESDEARAHAANVATDKGECFRANRWLSLGLVVFLSAACVFFAFTDSVLYKGKVYYGFALPTRLNLFNLNKKEEQKLDVGLQKCFFPNTGKNDKELLKNLPLGMAVPSSFVFMIFPTNRRGIGSHCSNSEHIDDSSSKSGKKIDGSSSNSAGEKEKANKPTAKNV